MNWSLTLWSLLFYSIGVWILSVIGLVWLSIKHPDKFNENKTFLTVGLAYAPLIFPVALIVAIRKWIKGDFK